MFSRAPRLWQQFLRSHKHVCDLKSSAHSGGVNHRPEINRVEVCRALAVCVGVNDEPRNARFAVTAPRTRARGNQWLGSAIGLYTPSSSSVQYAANLGERAPNYGYIDLRFVLRQISSSCEEYLSRASASPAPTPELGNIQNQITQDEL